MINRNLRDIPRLRIIFTDQNTNLIGKFRPKEGKKFLKISMSIINHRISIISIEPFNVKIVSDKVIYSYNKRVTQAIDKPLEYVELLDGGTIKGSMVFEVPLYMNCYRIEYKKDRRYIEVENIRWDPIGDLLRNVLMPKR